MHFAFKPFAGSDGTDADHIRPSSGEEMDAAIATLNQHKDAWLELSVWEIAFFIGVRCLVFNVSLPHNHWPERTENTGRFDRQVGSQVE